MKRVKGLVRPYYLAGVFALSCMIAGVSGTAQSQDKAAGKTEGNSDSGSVKVGSMVVSLWSQRKEANEVYHSEIIVGSRLVWQTDTGHKELWGNGERKDLHVLLSATDMFAFDKVGDSRLLLSRDPSTNPSTPPIVEVIACLSDGRKIVVLPRTSRPDSSIPDMSSWQWSLRQDPFGKKAGTSVGVRNDTSHYITLGASFDLINKTSIDNVYSNISLFAPNMYNIFSWLRIGLDAGFFQYRNMAGVLKPNQTDSYFRVKGADTTFHNTTYGVRNKRQTDNLGLFANPTIRVSRDFYLFLNVEYRHRSITQTPEYAVTKADSGMTRSGVTNYAAAPNPEYAQPTPVESATDELLFGPGFMASVEDDHISFDLSASVTNNWRDQWSMLFQFELLEKSSSLKLGGEVRTTEAFSSRATTDYLIYLAKELPISAISDFFKSSK